MTAVFDSLITGYIENKIGIANHFLGLNLSRKLKGNLLELFEQQRLQIAGTGLTALIDSNEKIRTDKIFWLDRLHNDENENSFFDLMDAFVLHLNATCFTGIKSYEFHYTMYEKGDYYKAHRDQFRDNDSRQFSMVLYLNEDWLAADGGELCVHLEHSKVMIAPMDGKGVFFKSNELLHEVLPTNKQRMSITGWLKC